jgi:2-(1,2-epoxy-1,2-dihydrophenyl)acetyl-CoA isomerase
MAEIEVEVKDTVAQLTISNPKKKNAIDQKGWGLLKNAVEDLSADSKVRCIIVTGAAEDFGSGADLSDPTIIGMNGLYRMREIGDALIALKRIGKPTIAKVKGVCVGASMGIAMACDLIVAAKNSRFSQIFIKRALAVDGASSYSLPRLVGLQKAKELAFFGEFISADDALNIGLICRVIEDKELDAFVWDWAEKLSKMPTVALSLTKSLLDNSFSETFEQAVENEARAQAGVFATNDVKEAMLAFAEKREPNYKGN